MNLILSIKIIASVFLSIAVLRFSLKYGFVALQIVPKEELRSLFRISWINSFCMLICIFGLVLLWSPSILIKDPVSTLGVMIIASLFLATMLANSATGPSESVIFWERVISELKQYQNKRKDS